MNVYRFVGVRMVRTKMKQNQEEYEKKVQGERKVKINRRYFFL
jgi:hypothetical protein